MGSLVDINEGIDLIKIDELPTAPSVSDQDWLVVNQGTGTGAVTGKASLNQVFGGTVADAKASSLIAKKSAEEARGYALSAASTSTIYPDVAKAQKDIDDGKVELGAIIYISSPNDRAIADEYKNINGVPVATGKSTPSLTSLEETEKSVVEIIENIPNEAVEGSEGIMAAVVTEDGKYAPFMKTDGRLCYKDLDGKLNLVASDEAIVNRPYIDAAGYELFDGNLCTKIVISTPESRILEAWTEDGGYYIETPEGLKRTGGGEGPVEKTPDNPIYSSALSTLAGMSTTRISVRNDKRVCYILVTWGQSLAQGWGTGTGDTPIADVPIYPENAWMFKSSRGAGKENPNRDLGRVPVLELEPLKETINGGWKETACSSIANHLISEVERTTGERITTLSFVVANGGKSYMDLTTGSIVWDSLVQGLLDAKKACEARGWTPVVLAMDAMAGETDQDGVSFMTQERYLRQLQQLDRRFNAEVRRIFDQPEDAAIIVTQTGHPASNSPWNIKVRQGQVDADGIGNLCLAGPNYQNPMSDVIHTNSLGNNRRGQQAARAILWQKFATGFRPIKIRNHVWVSDSVFRLVFDVPKPPLILDKSGSIINTEGLGPGLGFIYDDYSQSPPEITAVTISSDATVEITLSKAPAGRSGRVVYANKRNDGNINQNGPEVGPRGVLRDSADFVSLYDPAFVLPNWTPSFVYEIQ